MGAEVMDGGRGQLPRRQATVIIDAVARLTTLAMDADGRDQHAHDHYANRLAAWVAALETQQTGEDRTQALQAALCAFLTERAENAATQRVPRRWNFYVYVHPVTWADLARAGHAGPSTRDEECHLPLPGWGSACVLAEPGLPPDAYEIHRASQPIVTGWLTPEGLDEAEGRVYAYLRSSGIGIEQAVLGAADILTETAARTA